MPRATSNFARLAALATLTTLASCSDPAEEIEPAIYTTFYPMQYFTERLADGAMPVVCPIPDGEDPITWQPSREVLAEYRTASLIVINGADFEHWVGHASLPASRVVSSADTFQNDFITYEATTHTHADGTSHTHEGIDGHTWLDPINAKAQATAIHDALDGVLETSADDEAFAMLEADLDALDARFKEVTPALEGVTLLASHPAYNYVARRYGWHVHNLDLDPEATLTDEDLASITAELSEGDTTRIMLWESEPAVETAERLLRDHQITSIVFSPCETLPEWAKENGQDYLAVMRGNLDRLQAALD